jgi:hypothetical protein
LDVIAFYEREFPDQRGTVHICGSNTDPHFRFDFEPEISDSFLEQWRKFHGDSSIVVSPDRYPNWWTVKFERGSNI